MIKNINVRNEKGVTMITLIVTVALLILITGIMANRSYTSTQLSNLSKLNNDIEILNDRIAAYFVEHGDLPIYKESDSAITMDKGTIKSYIGEVASNDGDIYYVIDLEAIDDMSLNYGEDYKATNSKNKYVINRDTHIIYYLKGINYDGKKYYSMDADIQNT